MLTRLLVFLTSTSPALRRALWRWWYNKLARQIAQPEWTFMNYGFAPSSETTTLSLNPQDEPDRFCIGLYEHVVKDLNIAGADLLEVGCGRGGGASYLARYHNPHSMLGVDFSHEAIAFCKRRHNQIANLQFTQGDAERLNPADASFDTVLNVESSHCYGNLQKFFDEVARVLKPGGHFAFADLRGVSEMAGLKRTLAATRGLEIIHEENISAGVIAAMQQDATRKQAMIERLVPPSMRGLFLEFAGMPGGQVFEGLKSGSTTYCSFLAQKRSAPDTVQTRIA